MGRTDAAANFFLDLYHRNLTAVWDSLLPAPDLRLITCKGEIKKVDLTVIEIAKHYLYNAICLPLALVLAPVTFALSAVSSLFGRVKDLSHQIDHPEKYRHPAQVQSPHIPEAFGFASSRFQDSAEGTYLDLSELKGIGTGDWDKVFRRPIQRVTQDGEKIGQITHGITLKKGEKLEDLFVNIIDHPAEFANLLSYLGCTAYRTSLERSVMEPEPGKFSGLAIRKYREFYGTLKKQGIEPWITLHHFTNPQWFEDAGGFTKEENIDGFVRYAEEMVEQFPQVTNWMTFNEIGIRGLEGYVRGEHPPEHKDVAEAAQVIRNLTIAHIKAFAAMKRKNPDLNVGFTHQWLRFLPFGSNPIEKITAYFFTHLIHTPLFNFMQEGKMHIRIPFKANVQLRYEDEAMGKTTKLADFLGVQAYGFPRIKVGISTKPYPGAADKVNNWMIPFLNIGFTAGSTCGEGDRMQFFGPPAKSTDLIQVLDEAFTIPKERIPEKGVSETGRDSVGMRYGDKGVSENDGLQAQGVYEILGITERYPLSFLFWWTLSRNCEWRSGGLPHLGLAHLKYDQRWNAFTLAEDWADEPPGIRAIREKFQRMQATLHRIRQDREFRERTA